MDQVLHRFRTDTPWALSQALNTRNRDREGEFVPMNLFPGQLKIDELIEDVRALNLTIQFRNEDHPVWDMVGLPEWSADFLERFEIIRSFGAAEVYELAKAGGDRTLVDGPVKIVIGKSRRQGLTSYLFGRAILRANLGIFSAICTAQKGDNAKLIFRYVQDFNDLWTKKWAKYKRETTSESKGSWEWEHKSTMRVQTAGGRASGRGDQADWYHFSEAAFYDDYQEVIDTLSAAPKHAWVFEESTANGTSGGYYERWKGALDFETILQAYANENSERLSKWNGYVRFFVSWLEDPACSLEVYGFEERNLPATFTPDEKVLVEKYGATLGNIKFRRAKIAGFLKRFDESEELSGGSTASGLSPEQWFNQEFPTTADEMFVATGAPIFNATILSELRGISQKTIAHGTYRMVFDRITKAVQTIRVVPALANLRIWEPPLPGEHYVIGGDIGKGMPGRDPSVLYVGKRMLDGSLKEVALWRGAIEPVEFGDIMVALGLMYNTAFIIGEMEGPMQGAMYRVVYDYLYPNVYHRMDPTHVRDTPAKDANTFTYGWNNNHTAKELVIGSAAAALKSGQHQPLSSEVLTELGKYRRTKKGKLSAPEGDNDDCVVSSSLAWFANQIAMPALQWTQSRVVSTQTTDVSEEKLALQARLREIRKKEGRKIRKEQIEERRYGRSMRLGDARN